LFVVEEKYRAVRQIPAQAVSRDSVTANTIAERLVTELSKPFAVADRPVSIGASVGVVIAPPNADPEAELRRADTRCMRRRRPAANAWSSPWHRSAGGA
jgi:predicted signal transduction protein with EAL and GGDEF domain